MRNIGVKPAYIPVLFLVTLALTLAMWQGCQPQSDTPINPTSGSVIPQTLSKQDPAVRTAIDVQRRNEIALMKHGDVVGTGIGMGKDGKPLLLILTSRDDVRGLPASIEGIPTRIDVVGDITAMGYTKKYRPVPCGVSVGNDNECAAGTIGCVVYKNGTAHMLSNNHVFARENNASIGESIVQPGRYDRKPVCASSWEVATLADFKPIVFSNSASNVIDAAIAEFTVSDFTCWMVNNLYKPASPVSPSVGLAVKKVGRTSGLTTGTITGINMTISVRYTSGTARFVNQIYVSGRFIKSGDSGSTMVTQDGNNLVGLNFAGSRNAAFANPITDVMTHFNVTVCP